MADNGAKPNRLSLTMVVRNCASTLEPLLASLKPYVDQMIFVLGGASDDNTEKVCRTYGDIVISMPWEWDWSKARNEALKHVTSEYWMWLDGDDEFENPDRIPFVLDTMDDRGWGRADFRYNYSYDEHGNVVMAQQRERIMRTSLGWKWHDPIHEWLHADIDHEIGFTDFVTVNHRRDPEIDASSRNLPVLLSLWEREPTPRTEMHIGHAYFSLGRFDEAQKWYEIYLEHPENDVNHWNIVVQLARCSMARKDYLGMRQWSLLAIELSAQYRDPYILLAHAAFFGEMNVRQAEKWLEIANTGEDAPLSVFRTPLEYSINKWDIEHRILADRGDFAGALKVVEQANELTNWVDPAWKGLWSWYHEAQRTERCRMAAVTLADEFVRRGDVCRAELLLNHCLPLPLRDDPAILRAQAQVATFLHAVEPEHGSETYKKNDRWFEHTEIDKQAELAVAPADLGGVSWSPRVAWYIERLLARGVKTVLEVGCHVGDVSRALAVAGFDVVGVDFNPNIIESAERLTKTTWKEGKPPRFYVKSMEELIAEGQQFDAVLLAEILEHNRPYMQIQMMNLAEQLAPFVIGSVPAELIGMQPGLYEDDKFHGRDFRPHIFEFDEHDLNDLILQDPSRRVVNNHVVKITDFWLPGFGNRVFEFDRERTQGLGIAFVLGPGLEHWTPRSVEDGGIGGSETAAVRLAEELASRGHFVTVYAVENGVHNGVVYRHYSTFRPEEEREVVVYSRVPDWITGSQPDLPWHGKPNARITALWCHDMAYPDSMFTQEMVDSVDTIIVVSEWHKQHFAELWPWLDMEKVTVIGNAIRIYDVPEKKQPHRFVFSSSPDRGLGNVLRMWPFIREMWPDAELHSFYGWSAADPLNTRLLRYRDEIMRDGRQAGVFMHGRIGQKELAEEMGKAQFWLYPSMWPDGQDFLETYCITAIEAQAYGVAPVTRRVAALPERIKEPQCFLDDWTTEHVLRRLKEWDTPKGRKLALNLRTWGRDERHLWKDIADKWLTLLGTKILAQMEAEPA